jgi:GT2 family glycosyltransferase
LVVRPVFSVVIPTHNRAWLVIRAIDSALASEGSVALEVIVVDDASTDATPQVLHERYVDEHRVSVLRSSVNEGPSGARNRGFAEASGTYVLFLDSDDTLLPHALAAALIAFDRRAEMQFLSLEGEERAVDGGFIERHVVRKGNPGWHTSDFKTGAYEQIALTLPCEASIERRMLTVGDFLPAILFGDLFYLSGLAMRREAVRRAGPFNRRFRFLEDWEFGARLCLVGTGGYLDVVGFHRETGRMDQLSMLGTPWRRAVMHHHVLAAVRTTCSRMTMPLPRTLPRAQAAADYWLGRCSNARGHARIARRYFFRSLRAMHKTLKSAAWLIAGFAGPPLHYWHVRDHRIRGGPVA